MKLPKPEKLLANGGQNSFGGHFYSHRPFPQDRQSKFRSYCISAVTEYEIYTGAALGQVQFWDTFLQKVQVVPFDKAIAKVAVDINFDLKRRRKQIAIPDLFIAATAVSHNLPLATLNKKHIDRVDKLIIIE